MPKRTVQEVRVGSHSLALSNLDKVMYPQTGFTKADVIDYYARVAPAILPHLKDRPLTLKRYPDGVEAPFFYQKECPPHPKWVDTTTVYSESNDKDIHYCMANKLETLVWLANAGDLEMHTFLAKAKDIARPTMVAFDLDPGPGADILTCAQVAAWLKKDLDALGLQGFPKVSGSKGIQVYVPLNTAVDYESGTKPFSRAMAERMQREHPDLVVSNMRKDLRTNKVLVDWSQNTESKTTVCVYSLRAKPEPWVSTPVTWRELAGAAAKDDPQRLYFSPEEVLRRVDRLGDLFEPVLTLKQKLPKAKAKA
ncbi:MAG TPA: non-homologous end-joining DNA ligase [Candidatus Thermoplasmatota archaeon]|nr:non-homologous end-joining DNA ligase [Candidatus Thermoplasmatota archaeon]